LVCHYYILVIEIFSTDKETSTVQQHKHQLPTRAVSRVHTFSSGWAILPAPHPQVGS